LAKEPAKSLPAVFAVPGNHDWYDSLVVFMALFARGKKFCGWQTYQNRSYFALKLPHGWWLFGTDMQLASSLDDAQMDYFDTIVRRHVKDDEKIILCNAEPRWITQAMYKNDPAYNNRNMGFFEGHILDEHVAIHVAGDRHYYKRHEEISKGKTVIPPESKSKIQKIVAGGGGAFLHPTHRENVKTVGLRHIYAHRASYPPKSTGFWLTFWNLLFPLWNLKFGIVTGILYVVTAQAFKTDLGRFAPADYRSAIDAVLSDVVHEPIATFWILVILLSFWFFTDTHKRYYRWLMGPIHALAHLSAVFLLGWAAASLGGADGAYGLVRSISLILVGGYLAGSMIMGIYLFLSLNVFGVHHNEAFSALKIESYKNFLRFRIDKNGDLTIFSIGIDRPAKRWRDGDKSKGEPKLVPDIDLLDAKYKPFLIEEPIFYAKPVVESAAEDQTKPTGSEVQQAPPESIIKKPI
jgi:hypothetical protein